MQQRAGSMNTDNRDKIYDMGNPSDGPREYIQRNFKVIEKIPSKIEMIKGMPEFLLR